jgi:hypothetical protein
MALEIRELLRLSHKELVRGVEVRWERENA